MKTKIFTWSLALMFLVSWLNIPVTNAQSLKPQDIFKKKYPNETIRLIKTADVNADKKQESFILTNSGNFYLINSKGIIVLINTGISDEEGYEDYNIQIYSVTAKEKHVALTATYFPSNTQMYVYRYKDGTLKQVLKVMGDIDVQIDKQGKVYQLWKNYKLEGGWDTAVGIFTWNPKTNKYAGSGKYVLQ